jgi:AcrR family transcriptional regulator
MQQHAPFCPLPAAASSMRPEQLVADQGASSLTLDAVAQAAGVSKGGLLYHYPNKDALLAAMIERHCDDLDERCARELEASPRINPPVG